MTEQHVTNQGQRRVFLIGLSTNASNIDYELE